MSARAWLFLALLAIGGIVASIKLSRSGLDKIKAHEALRLKKYRDQAGKWSIGWGHLIGPGESYLLDEKGIDIATAERLLKSDVADAERAVNQLVKVPLTGNQFDALVSFTFNLGQSALAGSTLLRRLNNGDYQGAADEFPRWVYVTNPETRQKEQSSGLIARRAKEQSLFLT